MHVLGAPDLSIRVQGHPPSPNVMRGAHWSAYHEAKQVFAQEVQAALSGMVLPPPLDRVLLHVAFWYPATKKVDGKVPKRDLDNEVASVKPVVDCLRAAGIIPDDNAEHLAAIWSSQVIGPVGSARAVQLDLYLLAPGARVYPAIA